MGDVKRIEFFKIYASTSRYQVYVNGRHCGDVFRWGKFWCSTHFEPFEYCKTRHEAALKLVEIVILTRTK